MPDTKKVFIVHGRDTRLRDDFFSFLRALGLQPIEWSEALKLTGKATPYTGEALESAFKNAQAVIVLLSPDDEVRLSPDLWKDNEDENEKEIRLQARPNVLFEAGMAFGTHHERTLLIEIEPLKSFSDVAGRHVVRLSDSPETRNEIAERLRTAGCDVSTIGSDWLTTGNFSVMRKIGKWMGTVPFIFASGTQAEDTFIRIFNNSSVDGEVTVDVTPGDGRVVEGVSLGTIPARTTGIFWAANIATLASVPLNSSFGAVFTVNAPKDSVMAEAIKKRPGGMDRVLPIK